MITINIREQAGVFAENKDIAKRLRNEVLLPNLPHEQVIVDFSGVEGATQSFVHALISEVLRQVGSDVLDKMLFKGCNDSIQKIISIVVDYMQESD